MSANGCREAAPRSVSRLDYNDATATALPAKGLHVLVGRYRGVHVEVAVDEDGNLPRRVELLEWIGENVTVRGRGIDLEATALVTFIEASLCALLEGHSGPYVLVAPPATAEAVIAIRRSLGEGPECGTHVDLHPLPCAIDT